MLINKDGVSIPGVGSPVIYQSKIGDGVYSPAVVLRTKESTVKEVIDRWGPEPSTVHAAHDESVTHETAAMPENVVKELPDDTTVDLLVHGLGKDYREYCVPYDQNSAPGTWRWAE